MARERCAVSRTHGRAFTSQAERVTIGRMLYLQQGPRWRDVASATHSSVTPPSWWKGTWPSKRLIPSRALLPASKRPSSGQSIRGGGGT